MLRQLRLDFGEGLSSNRSASSGWFRPIKHGLSNRIRVSQILYFGVANLVDM
eukprot:m.69995 g.69995  ORF g.69995 m.69995 type:complete len:52 (-) comp9990_c0_seq3:1424-1579(-)